MTCPRSLVDSAGREQEIPTSISPAAAVTVRLGIGFPARMQAQNTTSVGNGYQGPHKPPDSLQLCTPICHQVSQFLYPTVLVTAQEN